jgi:hypothetical protein
MTHCTGTAYHYYRLLALGGLVVACLPVDPRFACSDPVDDEGFLRETKIRNMTSFAGEVKPSAPCRKILRHVKEPSQYESEIS